MTEACEAIEGGCLCGAVRYRAKEAPFAVGYCHCRRCQRGLGNVFATACLFRRHALEIALERLTLYQSSPTLQRGFCGACGTPLIAQHADRDYTAVWLGTLDDPGRFEPTVQWHAGGRVPWVCEGRSLPDETASLAGRKLR